MAITGAQLVQDAMFQCGVLGQDGVTVPDADQALVLRRLNRMLDSWANENLLTYALTTTTLPLTAGTAMYTSAQFANATRPVEIVGQYVTYAGVDYPLDLIDNILYDQIGIKTIQAIPTKVYVNMTFPNAQVTFFPVPFANMTATFDCQDQFLQNVTAGTNISLPPGYEKAIVDALACDIAPSFGRQVTPDMRDSMMKSMGRIKRTNLVPAVMTTDFDGGDNSYDLAYICKPW